MNTLLLSSSPPLFLTTKASRGGKKKLAFDKIQQHVSLSEKRLPPLFPSFPNVPLEKIQGNNRN